MMDPAKSYRQIAEALAQKGYSRSSADPTVFEGELSFAHLKTDVAISIPDPSFGVLPDIRITNMETLDPEVVSHVEEGGRICWAEQSFLTLDIYQPGRSILSILELAKNAMEENFGANKLRQYAKEAPLYWGHERLYLLSAINSNTRHLLLDGNLSSGHGIVRLPLKKAERDRASTLLFWDSHMPRIRKSDMPSTLKAFVEWLCQAGFSGPEREDIVQDLCRTGSYFFNSRDGVFGLKLLSLNGSLNTLIKKSRPSKKASILVNHGEQVEISRVTVEPSDLATIVDYSSIDVAAPLRGKKIALIGCGTIGSHLARYLVQMGAGVGEPLYLFDDDTLSGRNLGRHALNLPDVGQNKATALSVALKAFHNDVSVFPVCEPAERHWARLKKQDMIIDATGSEMFSDRLNQMSIIESQNGSSPPILHAFLFGNAVAAQTFLNIRGDGHSCYRCLRPDIEGPWRYDPRRDPMTETRLRPGACGESYIPYGVTNSVSAAALAGRAIVDYFMERSSPSLRTMELDPSDARQIPDVTPTPSKTCPACGNAD